MRGSGPGARRGLVGLVIGLWAGGAALAGPPVEHGAVALALGPGWSIQRSPDGAVLTGRREGYADASMLAWAPTPLAGRTLAAALVQAVEALTRGRTVTKVHPAEPALGKTVPGIGYAAQTRVTRGADGSTWIGMYYLLEVRGQAQLVALVAGSAPSFQALAKEFATALDQATPLGGGGSPPGGGPPSIPVPGPGGERSFQASTGARSDEYVAGVVSAQSAALAPVPFAVAFVRRAGMLDKSFPQASRDGKGRIFYNDPDFAGKLLFNRAVMDATRPGAPVATAYDLDRFGAELTRLHRPKFPTRVSATIHVEGVADGSLVVGVDDGSNHRAYLAFRPDGTVEAMTRPGQLAEFVAEGGKPAWQSWSFLRPWPDGQGAWLFAQLNPPAKVARLVRQGPGTWTLAKVQPRWNGQPATLRHTSFMDGAAAPDGSYLWFDKQTVWHMAADGTIRSLVKLPYPEDDVTLSNVVALANRDLWIGFNTKVEVLAGGTVDTRTGVYTHRNTQFSVGDRSRLVRIRLDGKGGATLGEVSGAALRAALAPQGFELASDLLGTALLRIDHVTGGLLAYDKHHEIVYGLTFRD